MSAQSSRFIDFWRAADRRGQLWFWVGMVSSTALVLSLITTIRLLNKPREVIRISCDGIPTLVSINERVYTEPNEIEIRAFVSRFAVLFARADSYSVVNDYVEVARMMAPKLRERFVAEARGGKDGRAGAIAVIEGLERRCQIALDTLELEIDKRSYPWVVQVRGHRQVVGEKDTQPFQLTVELVRASREEILEGLLVDGIKSGGGAFGSQINK